MEAMRFYAPVRLTVDGVVVEISAVDEALDFLARWPESRRGPVYDCAVRGCRAAMHGAYKVQDARRGLESFARITGILVRGGSVLPVIPADTASSGLPADGG